MKILPCGTCHDDAILPDGKPYRLASFPGSNAFTFKCSRCKRKTTLLASEFARLPERKLGEGGRTVFPSDAA